MFSRVGWVMRLRKITTTVKLNANHYEVLGVKPTATAEEIKMAYFEKTKLYHPDKASSTEENLRNFRLISEAYEILGNASSRKFYNENVLGLTIKTNEKEDSCNNYVVTKMRNNEKLEQWTKNHLDSLRKEYFLGKQQAVRRSADKTNKSVHIDNNFFILLFICVIFCFIILQKIEKNKTKI